MRTGQADRGALRFRVNRYLWEAIRVRGDHHQERKSSRLG